MLGHRAALPMAVLAAGVAQCVAMPVHIAFDWPRGTAGSAPAHVHIQATRAVGKTTQSLPVEAEAGPDGALLELGEGVWLLQASAPGYWSQAAEVQTSAARLPAEVRLSFWPAATLHGEVEAPDGELLPAALEVRLSAVPTASRESATAGGSGFSPELSPPEADLNCPISGKSWNCVGPAGTFDVRVEASGFVPRYTWSVRLQAGESTDAGKAELKRQASVFGRAVRQDGSDPPVPCRATLRPDTERRTGPEPDPDRAAASERELAAQLSTRGYFQMVGALPGRHVLAVDCAAASGFRELMVQADGETRIDTPLKLDELTIEFGVTPKVDPEGCAWKLSVEATTPRLRRIADKVTLPGDGRWERRGLMAGNYRVTVSSADGTEWAQRNFDLRMGSGPLTLRVAGVKVAGRVMLGAQPVRARLLFSNQAGGEPATLNSNLDGRFRGLLPIAPDARETSWNVEAHVAQLASTRQIVGVNVSTVAAGASAWLDLALPLIAVRGIVVSEDGKPARGTQIILEDSGGRRTTTSTDDGGRFEMPELPEGKYTAVAESEDGASDRTPFEVLQGTERELTLTLHASMRVAFQVVANQQPVAEAAVQVWIEPGVPRAFARTDQDGRFEVKLPRGTSQVALTVGAPGYAVKLTRMAITDASDAAENANTITLDTSGGTLELGFEPPEGALEPGAMLYVAHNGAIQDARTIGGWGTDQAGTSGDGPAIVEAIEPGDYALCVLSDRSELATVWTGALPRDRCRTGTVQKGQTLTLEPPAGPAQNRLESR